VPEDLKRYYGAGDLHFITCSCYRRRALLGTAERRDLFLDVLKQVRRRYEIVVVGYVVMPEHFHLLVTEREDGAPSAVMQILKQTVSRKIRRSGDEPFWERRSYDFNVWTEAKRVEKLRYMHRNPVKRGLVAEPEDWAWSSFRHYRFGEVGRVQVDIGWKVISFAKSASA
jgi:putative transposase